MADQLPAIQQSMAVNNALEHAVELFQNFGNAKDFHNENPEDIFRRLDQARAQVRKEWNDLQGILHQPHHNNNDTKADGLDEQETRVAFIEMITDAFADALESLRRENKEVVDVEILADCLQSGFDLMTTTAVSASDFCFDEVDGEDALGQCDMGGYGPEETVA